MPANAWECLIYMFTLPSSSSLPPPPTTDQKLKHHHTIHAIVIYIYTLNRDQFTRVPSAFLPRAFERALGDGIIIINSNLTYNDNSFQHLFFVLRQQRAVMNIAIALPKQLKQQQQPGLVIFLCCCVLPVVDNIVAEIIKQNLLPRSKSLDTTHRALWLLSQSQYHMGYVSNA